MSLFSSLTRTITPRFSYTERANVSREHLDELQQKHRFLLSINGVDSAFITDVQRPSYSVTTQKKRLLNWDFNYPTTVTWSPISFSMVEIFSMEAINSIAGVFMDKLQQTAYDLPNDLIGPIQQATFIKDVSKRELNDSLGPVKIRALHPDGRIVEEWELRNAMVTSMIPEQYSYANDTVSTIRITLTYDWATYQYLGQGSGQKLNAKFGQ